MNALDCAHPSRATLPCRLSVAMFPGSERSPFARSSDHSGTTSSVATQLGYHLDFNS
jgi:hypothetical protein